MPLTAALITGVVALLLMRQPNFGETIIFVAAWVALLALAGFDLRILDVLGAAGLVGIVLAYLFYDVATARIDGFLFARGRQLPGRECHADADRGRPVRRRAGRGHAQILAARAAHRLYLLGDRRGVRHHRLPRHRHPLHDIVVRVLVRLLDEEDKFPVLAAAGLVCQFGLQALINMAVNVHIAPSKGMTLPFISYGGSSMIALAIGFGRCSPSPGATRICSARPMW